MIGTVLFDLDGTILNTNELIFRSFEYVWEQTGRTDITREHMIPYMGGKLEDMFRMLSKVDDPEEVEKMIRFYREYNWAHHDELVVAFPGVQEVLGELSSRGVRMGVVTTKIRRTTEMGLKLCGLFDYMEAIVTLDDVKRAKPDPEPVLRALELMNAAADETLMVGDSPGDVLAAQGAGVAAAVVGWTLRPHEQMKGYNPDYWIEHMRDLLSIVD